MANKKDADKLVRDLSPQRLFVTPTEDSDIR